jgi:hypothetical protein
MTSNKKRKREEQGESQTKRARFLYMREDAYGDGTDSTILSYSDLALGERVHTFLLSLANDDEINLFFYILRNEDDEEEGESRFPKKGALSTKEARDLIESIPEDVFEVSKRKDFGHIQNGLSYIGDWIDMSIF